MSTYQYPPGLMRLEQHKRFEVVPKTEKMFEWSRGQQRSFFDRLDKLEGRAVEKGYTVQMETRDQSMFPKYVFLPPDD